MDKTITDTTDTTDALDRAAMARLVAGDGAALNHLLERHATRLFHYLIRLIQNESDAEELAHETFVRVFRHAHRYNPAQRFSTWLYTIATNLVRDRHRRHVRHPHLSLESAEDHEGASIRDSLPASGRSPAQDLASAETVAAVQRAIAELPDELRIPIILAEYEEASYHEIAAIVGGTTKSVEMKLYRARKLLRTRLSTWLG
jgi:RNA polymerase sigma-70 factor, ECF subfamily